MEQGSCRSTFDAPCRRHRLWYGNLCFLPNLHAGYLEGRRTKSFGAGELPVALFHSGLFDRAVYFPIVLPVYLWDGGLAAVEPREKDGVCLLVRRCRFGAAFAFIPLFRSESVPVWGGGASVRRGSPFYPHRVGLPWL